MDKIEVYSILGAMIFRKSSPNKQLDITNLNSGLYFLHVYSNQKIEIKKFIKN
ncbi:T9SS type A sorting domain-containing protein [Hyunsoonleella jejuensis]|uniref:T9SS type A sorting domain-containing protein n=1 Tax=Hyunsoonleella jejuensis TaxID=419940 RepID=UPI000B8212AE